MAARFKSSDELWASTKALITALEQGGDGTAAEELRKGMGCVNGLTDGYAQFLDSVRRVRDSKPAIGKDHRQVLESIYQTAYYAVSRCSPMEGWLRHVFRKAFWLAGGAAWIWLLYRLVRAWR